MDEITFEVDHGTCFEHVVDYHTMIVLCIPQIYLFQHVLHVADSSQVLLELYEVQLLQGQHHGQILRAVDRESLRIAARQVFTDIEVPAQKQAGASMIKQEDDVPINRSQKNYRGSSDSEITVKREIIKEEQPEDEKQTQDEIIQ